MHEFHKTKRCTKLFTPQELQKAVLAKLHDSLYGHFGVKRTEGKISQQYYWFNLMQDVKWHAKCRDVYTAQIS